MMRPVAAASVVVVIACSAWSAEVTVRAVVPPVKAVRAGEPPPIELRAGMRVADGDELLGGSESASVQLECANGATQTLSAKFDAVVNARSAGTHCAIDLKAGTAVATALSKSTRENTDNEASISGGAYAMTSHHTQFGLSVVPDSPLGTAAFVVDGEAVLKSARKPGVMSLRQGQQYDAKTRKLAPIPQQTFERIATAYARLDLAQLGRAVAATESAVLQSRWLASLKAPGDAAAYQALADTHARLGLTSSAVSKYVGARAIPGGGAAANWALPSGTTYQLPMNGAHRLDYCLPNNRCGRDTALAWCQAHGFSGFARWQADIDIGDKTPTQRLGGSDVCARGPCDGFKSITCQ